MKKGIIIIVIILLIGVGCFFLYQYTELFGEKLIPIKIDQVSIDYVPGYSLDDAKAFNQEKEVVKIQTSKVLGKDFKKIKSEVHYLSKKSFTKKQYGNHQVTIHINDNVSIEVGNGYGYVIKNKQKTKVKIPNKTMNVIHQIVQKDQKKRIKTLETENVTVKLEGSSITVKNAENLGNIYKYLSYYPIDLNADFKTYDNGYLAEVLLDQNKKIYLYSSKIGYIVDGDQAEYGIFENDLYELLKKIYDYSVK